MFPLTFNILGSLLSCHINYHKKITQYIIEQIRYNFIESSEYYINCYYYRFLIDTNYVVFFDNKLSDIKQKQKNIIKKLYLLKK